MFPATPALADVPADAKGLLGGHLIKGDFSGYVTEPLQAGDVVHLYWVGLGAVLGSVRTGEPAPLDELRPAVEPLRCRFLPNQPADPETLFEGLAPGLVGVYQMTLRIPSGTPFTPNGIHCGSIFYEFIQFPVGQP